MMTKLPIYETVYPGEKMHFFISFVLMYAGNRISAEMFQTSRTDSISDLAKVDGQTVFSSDFLLFDVKSCNEVQFLVNFDDGMARMDIYPNRSLQVEYCYKGPDCTVEMFTVTGDTCDGYTPFWVQVPLYGVVIGEGCDVEESKLSSSPWRMLLYGNINIGISSADDAWWRLGESACKPVNTTATTTTLTTHPTTTPATTSEAPGSLVNDTTKNETMHKNVNMGRSGGAVCNKSPAVMTMVATYVLCYAVPCRVNQAP